MKEAVYKLDGLKMCLLLLVLYCTACSLPCKPGKEHAQLFNELLEHATLLKDSGDSQKAIRFLDSAYRTVKDAGPGDQSRYLDFRAKLALQQGKYQQANLYADSILHLLAAHAKDPNYNIYYAEAYLTKGDILFVQGLYSYAFQYFYKSKIVASSQVETHAYHRYLAHYFDRRAMISFKQEQFDTAACYYRKMIAALDSTDRNTYSYVYDTQGALSNVAASYWRSGKADSSLHYYNRCLDFIDQHQAAYPLKKDFFLMAKGVCLGNMGDPWMLKRNYKKAEELYLADIAINGKKGRYEQDALMTRLKLAKLYTQTGRFEEAGVVLTSVGQSPVLADADSEISFLMTRANYYKATGHYAEALNDMLKRSAIRDSVTVLKRKLLGVNSGGMFAVLEKDYQNEALAKRDELKNYLLWAASIAVGMSLLTIRLLIKHTKTAKKHIEEANARNQEQQLTLHALAESNKENARLSGILAHDLKNPIHAISTIATLMLEDDRSEEDREMLGLLKESIMKLNDIVNDVLKKGEDINLTALHLVNTDIAALLRHSVTLLQFKAGEKQQRIIKSRVKKLIIRIDQHKIWRVINNLLVNAIKFSPRGTTVRVSLEEDENDTVKIAIQDEGIGIPDELKPHIFTRSGNAQRTGTAGEETFGIGLFTSRQIVEAHGGKLYFENPETGGTIFYLILPLKQRTDI
ncbi:HAMP domain-containing histidine kinase [Mucilaginibacter sp. RS28]|uniref:histidine kinase n=1 Tax=Mucilaginibacter straminoryzae TaxID=2932774 RepID=A0A9X1XAU4_9SPHI|nr:HAMP domain-containing sensor histidine kinase [Mucilaginibacter straminoryzae]MCJ8211369.1 HAMP domain-containing histidine kinase [Mucilaginibacter straminoryzae]